MGREGSSHNAALPHVMLIVCVGAWCVYLFHCGGLCLSVSFWPVDCVCIILTRAATVYFLFLDIIFIQLRSFWVKHTGQTLWSHLPSELTVHKLLMVRSYDWGSSGGMPSCCSVDIVLVLMQNFLKCSLRVFNLGLVNQVWNLLLAEAQHQVGCSFVVVGEDVDIFEFGRTCPCLSKLSRLSNL